MLKNIIGLIVMGLTGFSANGATSVKELETKIKRFAPVALTADVSQLSEGDRKALAKIIEGVKLFQPLFLSQVWEKNPALAEKLEADKTRLGKLTYDFFTLNAGPWSRLDNEEAFVSGVPAKPLVANFYPEDMTKAEFETWVGTLPEKEKNAATGFFTRIVRTPKGELKSIPYSEFYKTALAPVAKLLSEAADLTTNASLKKFLQLRVKAFSTNDYYDSDVAWMELDAPVDVTIGPYETYEDGLFNYKAAFAAFITIRNDQETAKIAKFSGHLQDIENSLPLEEKYRNPKIGALAPIRVVDQVFASGDARRGVMTAAFNLPNDEKLVKEKGSKRVMLKNVQAAKFEKALVPISKIVLSKTDQKNVDFDAFFTHILTHELMHGLGPTVITIGGKESSPRKELKEIYGSLEEAKADIMGLFAMQYFVDKGVIDKSFERTMYTTYLASTFRSVRFGLTSAHARGLTLQFNYLTNAKALAYDAKTKTFRVNADKIKDGVRSLTGEILKIQATGDYVGAKTLFERFGKVGPEMAAALKKMSSIPVDVRPYYPVAGESLGERRESE